MRVFSRLSVCPLIHWRDFPSLGGAVFIAHIDTEGRKDHKAKGRTRSLVEKDASNLKGGPTSLILHSLFRAKESVTQFSKDN